MLWIVKKNYSESGLHGIADRQRLWAAKGRGLQRRRERRIAQQALVVRSGEHNLGALRESRKNGSGIAERGADARWKRRIAEEGRGLEGGK